MGIEIRTKKQGNTDVSAPVIVCDHCGKVIEDARDGNYHWTEDDPRITFTHKHCFDSFEKAHADEGYLLTAELYWLLPYLGTNLDLDWREAWLRAKDMAGLPLDDAERRELLRCDLAHGSRRR